MKIDILTLFPASVSAVLHESIIGRATAKGIVDINCIQIRDFTENRQNQVDDYPYGGGFGCVMMAQPLKSCLDSVLNDSVCARERTRVIYMSPQGTPFNQACARRLKEDYDHLILVCGHYEGIDERFIEKCVDEEISIGDFVLTGGEIAAMAVADCVCRMVPGVLADEECFTDESHWDGLLEYPQYTRPEVWEGLKVPEILLNGNHDKINKWRRKQQFIRTKIKRADMYSDYTPATKEDAKLQKEAESEMTRLKLTEPLSCRIAQKDDIDEIVSIAADAKDVLKKRGVDQWQGPYPTREDFLNDIKNREGRIILHGSEPAAYFVINQERPPEYDAITDGKWTDGLDYCVIHRACVKAKYRGTGISSYLMKCADEICEALGIRCIRVDTHRKNKSMQRLLNDCGYRYRGNILVISEPGHDPARQAFEKILKVKK